MRSSTQREAALPDLASLVHDLGNRSHRDDPALDSQREELIKNDVGATHGQWRESLRRLLDPLLHIGAVKTTELCVTEERQYVAIKRFAVTHPGRRSIARSRLPPRLGKFAHRLTTRLAINERQRVVVSGAASECLRCLASVSKVPIAT